MFDDLRKEATSIYESDPPQSAPVQAESTAAPKARKRQKKILGMTGPQRFVIVSMLALMVCMMGFMFLLITGKIGF